MRYSAIIVAAGSGLRSGLPYSKVLTKIDGKPLVYRAYEVFKSDSLCKEIILVIKESDEALMRHMFEDDVRLVYGKDTRSGSVYEGLKAAKEAYVMIHDGARLLLDREVLVRLEESLGYHDAVTAVLPVYDTLKRVKEGVVVEAVEREGMVLVQTPQAFKREAILNAHKEVKNEAYTCDASLYEGVLKMPVHTVLGNVRHQKLTTQDDILTLEMMCHDPHWS